jgi:hypothetical protein
MRVSVHDFDNHRYEISPGTQEIFLKIVRLSLGDCREDKCGTIRWLCLYCMWNVCVISLSLKVDNIVTAFTVPLQCLALCAYFPV